MSAPARVMFDIVAGPATVQEVKNRRVAMLKREGSLPLIVTVRAGAGRIEVPIMIVGYRDKIAMQQVSDEIYFSGYLPADFARLDRLSSNESAALVLVAEQYFVHEGTGILSVPAKYEDLARAVALHGLSPA